MGDLSIGQLSGDWPTTASQAEAVQERLRPLVDLTTPGPESAELVAGLDVGYAAHSDEVTGAIVVLDSDLRVVDQATARQKARFPYIPGLFAFRELPPLLAALDHLTVQPDLLICDGYGLAHPRRFGLACHLGVLTGLPTVGVAKTSFVGTHQPPDLERGSWTPLLLDGTTVGRALRTQTGVKPVYVSQGHRISLENATANVLRVTPAYRQPEPIRLADRLSRAED
ncbi:deoxyribonuclease V [Acrocarpospora catenulata]|uniref:deoxyribonuclease V n=1 Tax=Acrocarpospora catenulata TaxID=2836182 RepID=UPI001BD97062|nr:deoxyribonuclease V [Acrocarpospora catenulata]